MDDGIKTLHLADGLARRITIDLQELLASPAQAEGQRSLMVNADAAVVVTFGQLTTGDAANQVQWSAQGTTTVGEQTYNVFRQSIAAN